VIPANRVVGRPIPISPRSQPRIAWVGLRELTIRSAGRLAKAWLGSEPKPKRFLFLLSASILLFLYCRRRRIEYTIDTHPLTRWSYLVGAMVLKVWSVDLLSSRVLACRWHNRWSVGRKPHKSVSRIGLNPVRDSFPGCLSSRYSKGIDRRYQFRFASVITSYASQSGHSLGNAADGTYLFAPASYNKHTFCYFVLKNNCRFVLTARRERLSFTMRFIGRTQPTDQTNGMRASVINEWARLSKSPSAYFLVFQRARYQMPGVITGAASMGARATRTKHQRRQGPSIQ